MHSQVQSLIKAAIEEDIGQGDVTSEYFIQSDTFASALVVAREPGVASGMDIAAEVFRVFDPSIKTIINIPEGKGFEVGQPLLRVDGNARSLLSVERTALNFLQRMCGVATLTKEHVEAVSPHPVKILDTRKTIPGWRLLDKQAVRAGGGHNHRMGLYDMVMVKDNHLLSQGQEESLAEVIARVKTDRPGIKVELEADTIEQVRRFSGITGVDRILLDNMSVPELLEAVALAGGKVELEASGGINLDTISNVASTGVDFISVGALTHSARALDLALDFLE